MPRYALSVGVSPSSKSKLKETDSGKQFFTSNFLGDMLINIRCYETTTHCCRDIIGNSGG